MLEVILLHKTFSLGTPWIAYAHRSFWSGSYTEPMGEITELADVLHIHNLETDELSYICTVSIRDGFAVSGARVSRIDGSRMPLEMDGGQYKPQAVIGGCPVPWWLSRALDVDYRTAQS